MKVIRACSRVHISAEDIAFICRVLRRDEHDEQFLTSLLADEQSRDALLDDPAIYRALVEQNHCIPVSLHFYFYVLVRRVFLNAGIDDRMVADYVASLLAEYSRTENQTLRIPPDQTPLEYVVDMMAACTQADHRTRFFIQAHIGNHTLFLTGVFAGRIEHRRETRGFPDIRYYEQAGAAGYRNAREHHLAERHELVGVYDRLSEEFPVARRALNDLSDRLLHFHEPAWLSSFLSQSSRQFN